MKKPAAIPLFGDAYLADTAHLTTEEHGAYLLLLIHAWRQDQCALRDDPNTLARIARLSPKKWRSIAPTIMEFFRETGDGRVYQPRLRKEWLYLMEKSEKAAEAAAARWNRDPETNGSPEIAEMGERAGTPEKQNGVEEAAEKTEQKQQIYGCERIYERNASPDAPPPPPPPPPHKNDKLEEEEDAPEFELTGESEPHDPIRYVTETWNGMARAAGLATVIKITAPRRKRLEARLRDYGEEPFADAIRAIPSRPFLMGKGPRGWKADFDFILRPDSAAKIMEGRYGDGDRKSGWAWVHD